MDPIRRSKAYSSSNYLDCVLQSSREKTVKANEYYIK